MKKLVSLVLFLFLISTVAAFQIIALDLPEASLSIEPEDPGPEDLVLFTADYIYDVDEYYLAIYVNDEKVEECESPMCRHRGGPYPDGFRYYLKFKDSDREIRETTEITVEFNPEEELPKLKDSDNDSIEDAWDNCDETPNVDQEDMDDDTVGDACDNCVDIPNSDQKDSDAEKEICNAGTGGTTCYIVADGIGDLCDNCPFTYNDKQGDADNDGRGDLCDNCPNDYNQGQEDLDEDGLGDVCDNCPLSFNPDQKDSDNDGEPDGCDCDDGIMGPSERGIDCGGPCAKCEGCIPLVYSASPSCAVDIVFVPDEDYGMNIPAFLDDVKYLINEGYYKTAEIAANKDKFNFYYVPEFGNYESFCAKFDFPDSYYKYCDNIADASAIVFTGEERACANGGKSFSADSDPARKKVVVHETGHIVFGLADEYAGYGGGYREGAPNIFKSLNDCQTRSAHPADCYNFCPESKCWPAENDTDSKKKCEDFWKDVKKDPSRVYECSCEAFVKEFGLSPSECSAGDPTDDDECPPRFRESWKNTYNISSDKLVVTSQTWGKKGDPATAVDICVNGGDGWWKADDGHCRMASGAYGSYFDKDCKVEVDKIISEIPYCLEISKPEEKKALKLKYIIGLKGVELKNIRISYNETPNYYAKSGSYKVLTKTPSGSPVTEAWIKDPRRFEAVEHEEFEADWIIKDEAEFIVYLPLEDGVETVDVEDYNGEILSSVDISSEIAEFCEGKEGEIGCAPVVNKIVPEEPELAKESIVSETKDQSFLIIGGLVVVIMVGLVWFFKK